MNVQFIKNYSDFLRFALIGGLNASIYFVIIMIAILVTDSYYVAVAVGQTLMAVIAYITFSKFHFNKKIEHVRFLKFILSNLALLGVSTVISHVATLLDFNGVLFGIMNVIIIAPLSYFFNRSFVFN